MKRTPMKRSTKRLPWKSAKREAITAERRDFVARILAERPTCEGLFYLRAIVNGLADRDQRAVVSAMRTCTQRSAEVHELKKRSRGGSILDDDNVAALCHWCHAWTEAEPRLATEAGLLIPSWQR